MIKKRILSLLFALLLTGALVGFTPSAKAAETARAGIVRTQSTRLNVRSSPSLSAPILTGLNRNSYVTIHGGEGDWWKVEYANGRYGWCHKDYVQTVSVTAAVVSADGYRLNIRSGPSTSYRVLSQFSDKSKVTVLSSSNGWARVLFDATRTGYVSEQYLRYAHSSDMSPSVVLSVPRYAQNDPRWASVRLGATRYTIGQIGCTTSAMAMVETCLRGYTVTPDAMARELSYSSGGSLYWPSSYTPYTASDYCAEIYRQLQKGRPVLVGGFTPGGAQHWVVAYGFTGGEICAENILIRDPGSASRKTLAEFQSKFSVFYKIMLRK